jgi:hypothetical protein
MSKNVPLPPLTDQIFTQETRQTAQNSSKNQPQKKELSE